MYIEEYLCYSEDSASRVNPISCCLEKFNPRKVCKDQRMSLHHSQSRFSQCIAMSIVGTRWSNANIWQGGLLITPTWSVNLRSSRPEVAQLNTFQTPSFWIPSFDVTHSVCLLPWTNKFGSTCQHSKRSHLLSWVHFAGICLVSPFDGWMASLTQWPWVWVYSGSWWRTGRPGVLWFMGSQRVGHDWATELNWTEYDLRKSQYFIC